MSLKPWREIAVPHSDVLEGTFQQAEFAADITAVRTGTASTEYQNPVAFFQRTFITEGMRLLLTSVAKRLNGQGGDPVIQLQTAFGGGKTHTMLAVYHLATRSCPLKDLVGIPALLDQAGLMDMPRARIAVLDGMSIAPGQPWRRGKQTVQTLWGELAWQIGEDEALEMVKEADQNGTSPGKEVLKALLQKFAPCVVLIDELVAYIRQFSEDKKLSGGTYDSNLTFLQALTEAAKLVPNAIILASLPESEVEAGSNRGVAALKALEKTFGRVQALWKPVATQEAFEIVRRRLFEPLHDTKGRDAVCRAYADTYIAEGSKLPSETQEARYFERLVQAYPIHPEVFDRLYEDWTTLESFQRTRGVLKLMAKVIYRLWQDQNPDLMIMPGSLPLYDGSARNELTYYLSPGWDAVLEKDIDGDRAETTALESKETRFGSINAARRVARTLFLGSAPSSVGTKPGNRGIDRARVLLGCLQPFQTPSTYLDALSRLADKLHYLNPSGDKSQDTTRFWFDTRANLRREMEDRKSRFNDQNEVHGKIAEILRKVSGTGSLFGGVHIFTPHADIPDDSTLRLVFLSPEKFYTKVESRPAFEEVLSIIRNNGNKPRCRGNRLLFIAPEQTNLARLRDATRTALAWNSIVEDVKDGRLNIDGLQLQQAKKELQSADDVLVRTVRECYKWLLCPVQHSPTESVPTIEAFQLNTSGALGSEIERISNENELVISVWSPVHLRTKLTELYWKPDKPAVSALAFWEDTTRYLYLPRLKTRTVLEQAISNGAGNQDFFGTAYGQHAEAFDGFKFGDPHIQLDDTLLLIDPAAAKTYLAKLPAPIATAQHTKNSVEVENASAPSHSSSSTSVGKGKAASFHGNVSINPSMAKVSLRDIADEIIAVLAADPNAEISLSLEIQVSFPEGVSEQTKRAVNENAKALKFRNANWE